MKGLGGKKSEILKSLMVREKREKSCLDWYKDQAKAALTNPPVESIFKVISVLASSDPREAIFLYSPFFHLHSWLKKKIDVKDLVSKIFI